MPNGKSKSAARRAKSAKMANMKALVSRKMSSSMSSSLPNKQKNNINNIQNSMSSAVTAAPTSYSRRMAFGNPSGSSASMRSIVKTEFITSIYGSEYYNKVSFHLNPGLVGSFPWLSKIAQDWQQYRFKKFQARFITRSSASTVGSVILSPEYNISDGPPASEVEAIDTQDAVEDVVWKELCCELDINAMFGIGPRKQVRSGTVVGGLATYDAAILSCCTVGQVSGAMIGKLFFDYEVEFFVPQSTLVTSIAPQSLSFFNATDDGLTNAVDNVPTGWLYAYTGSNPLAIDFTSQPGFFVPPPGNYLVTVRCSFYGANANSCIDVNLGIVVEGEAQDSRAANSTLSSSGGFNVAIDITRTRMVPVTSTSKYWTTLLKVTSTAPGAAVGYKRLQMFVQPV